MQYSVSDAQEYMQRLLNFAVCRERVRIPDDLIKDCVFVTRADPASLSDADQLLLWRCLNRLTTAVHPATVASIKIVEDLEVDRLNRPSIFRQFWKDAEGRKQIRWASRILVIVLFIVLVTQIYTLVLSTITRNIEAQDKTYSQVNQEIGKLKAANPTAFTLQPLEEQRLSVGDGLDASYAMLVRWSAPWDWLLKIPDTFVTTGTPDVVKRIVSQQGAGAVLEALSTYILPLLYGLLGAAAHILRSLNKQIAESTFAIMSTYRYRLRLALGALLGATIGLFFTPGNIVFSGLNLSLVAVAFIAGYSVEVVFTFFDYLIDQARSRFKTNQEGSSAGSATQPTGMAQEGGAAPGPFHRRHRT